MRHTDVVLASVCVILQPPVALFELGVLAEVFGIDRSDDGVPRFDYRVCAEQPGEPIEAGPDTFVVATHPLEASADADLVAVPSSSLSKPPSDAVVDVLRSAAARGAYVMSLCSGAFAVAAAGLLDDRTVATHWRYADLLARMYPEVHVDADVLYAQDGTIVSSAGTASGIDACLHLVRAEHGSAVANRIARRMVVPPHRAGGQKQFIETPVTRHADLSLQPVLTWATDNLANRITVAQMARTAGTSSRTLIRRFTTELGSTPHEWLTRQRIIRAQELLEQTRLSIEDVARDSGFGAAPLLRHHFTRAVGITPTHYRRQFTNRTINA